MVRSMKLGLVVVMGLVAVGGLARGQTQSGVAAPALTRCCYDHYRGQLLASIPGLKKKLQLIDAQAAQPAARNGAVYRIPVVVHVVYASNQQNLSVAQVQSQIDVLNEDFRRLNPDAGNTLPQFQSVAADTGIEFCLATVDPSGQPTNGITRRQTTVQGFSPFFDDVKSAATGGTNPWPASQYLNIWTCPLTFGVLGYATPPGTPANLDGVVIDWGFFGRPGLSALPGFGSGRTCTHEVGHYLNLFHLWGGFGGCGDDDQVADTPNQAAPTNGCTTNQSSCGSLDMSQNYLDYTNDSCMNLFTQGQATRMRALFGPGGARVSLLTSPAACPTGPLAPDYQVNSAAASFDIDGVQGTATTAPFVVRFSGQQFTVNLSSTSTGLPWDLAYGVAALLPGSGGAYVSPGGQLVNLDLADPAFGTWFPGGGSPPFVSVAIPVTSTTTLLSLQMGVVSPASPDGVALSQPVRLRVF